METHEAVDNEGNAIYPTLQIRSGQDIAPKFKVRSVALELSLRIERTCELQVQSAEHSEGTIGLYDSPIQSSTRTAKTPPKKVCLAKILVGP